MRERSWVLIGVLLAAVGCGGSSPTGSLNNSPPPPPNGNVADVSIQDFQFQPATLTIKAGTTVRWTNNGPSAHTTTSDNGVWDSKTLAGPSGSDPYGGGGGQVSTFEYTFNTPGTYTYHCNLHPPSAYPSFTGTITVTP